MSKNFLVIKNFELIMVFMGDSISYKVVKDFFENNFTYYVQGYKYSNQYKYGLWDGKRRVYKLKYDKGIFKIHTWIGFLDGILEFLEKVRLKDKFSIIDATISNYNFVDRDIVWIGKYARDYQMEAVYGLLKRRYGIVSLPTGSGKMLVSVLLFYLIRRRGVIVLRNMEAIFQMEKEFLENVRGFNVRLYFSREKNIEGADIVLTTYNSFYRSILSRDDLFKFILEKSDVLLFDEAHHVSHNTYKEAIQFYSPFFIYGMTGTVFRNDNADLEIKSTFGSVSYKVETTSLQKAAVLSTSNVFFIEVDDVVIDKENIVKDFPGLFVNWHFNIFSLPKEILYKVGIVYNLKKIGFIKKIIEEFSGRKILILSKYSYHGRYLSRILNCDFVHGKTNKIKRKEILQRFTEDKNYNILVASTIYDESVNIPLLDVVINAGGHSSIVAQVQRHGRGVRKSDHKPTFIFVDFYDSFDKSSLLHSKRRMMIMKKEGLEPKIIKSVDEILPNLTYLNVKEKESIYYINPETGDMYYGKPPAERVIDKR